MLSVDDVREGLERRGLIVKRVGGYYSAQCPAHHDEHPSLIFGQGRRDEGAFVACMTGCQTKDVLRALNVAGTAAPLTPEELERRRAEEEADRDARIARARARYELALVHPDRRAALEHFAPALRWDVAGLLELGVGWDGGRVTFPIRGADGVLEGIERYAPPSSRARQFGPKTIAHGPRGLWPAPEAVDEPRYLVEGAPCAATLLGCGLAAVAFPNASGVRRCDAERLLGADAGNLVVLADADGPGRRAAQVSVLVLRDVGVRARGIDLFDGADTGADVADELRTRPDGVGWLLGELAELDEPATKEA